jgi:ribonuclease-3
VPKDLEQRYALLEKSIGYRFRDRLLLEQALTHPSHANEASGRRGDNQRLEFFGDAILAFLVSNLLFAGFPEAREGELSRMRAALVDEVHLAGVAAEIDLGNCLSLGKGELKSGGREKRSILADSFEALLAAVYLDGGIVPARRVVKKLFAAAVATAAEQKVISDCKTELQEVVQARFASTPRYELVTAEGPDHARIYTVRVVLTNNMAAEGNGRSKKEAQQAAARAALALLER